MYNKNDHGLMKQARNQRFTHLMSCLDSFRVTAVESTVIGAAIGRIKADDPDVGRNAEMEYIIVGGHDSFNIITDQITQEGVIIIKKVPQFYFIFCFSLFLILFYMCFPQSLFK